MKKGKMPAQCAMNGLEIVHLKDSEGNNIDLTDLEAALVSKNLLFMQIVQLPRSRWAALRHKTVNVPITDQSI